VKSTAWLHPILFVACAFVHQVGYAQVEPAEPAELEKPAEATQPAKIDKCAPSFELRAAYLNGMEASDLEGSGFTTSISSSKGNGAHLQFRWNQAAVVYSFNYLSISQRFDAPGAIAPTQVDGKLERVNVQREFSLNPDVKFDQGSQPGLTLFWGLESRKRSATVTSPNTLMPTQSSIGALAGVAYLKPVNDLWTFDFHTGIYVPIIIDESSPKTGYYKYSLNPEASAEAIYRVNDFIDFSVGLQIVIEQITYTGTGNRGTTDAVETASNLILPVELRFTF
jgi:hypothetical protein